MSVPSSPAGEQLDALRRVADLIARGAGRTAVLNAIVAETYSLFPVEFTAMLSYAADGAATIVAVHHGPPGLAVGERAPHIPEGLVLRVFGSGRPARVEAYDDLPGPGVERMRELGISAGAAAPILVDGGLWGVLTAMTRSGPVAPGLEHRLADFAEIAATAVAGAQATHERRGLADEQAALRRVAELAARGADPRDVFERLVLETSALLPGTVIAVTRFGPDGDAISGGPSVGGDLAAVVRRTGRVARHPGRPAAIAVPLHVEGTVWGMLTATSSNGPLADDTERRLTPFAEIAAVATAGATARAGLHRIADEQAALRRVAEIVARGGSEQQLFDAVTEEAGALMGDEATTLARFTGERTITIVATRGGPATAGAIIDVPEDDRGLVAEMLRTRRPARLDDYGTKPGKLYARSEFGVGSSVAVPIMVYDRMWGMLGVVTSGHRLPADTELRLGQFADLVAAALANSQDRARVEQLAGHESALRNDLRALADEQAALLRVAELVARGTALDDVFQAVTAETAKLVGSTHASLQRHDRDGAATTVATFPAGSATPPATGAELTVPVVVEGRMWGALTTSTAGPPRPDSTEGRLRQFAGLAAAAIANAENKAHLTASRARVVATADETRRRLQRDVHDGAQQRLVQTIITLKIARDAIARGDIPDQEIGEALYHAERANAELRDLVHGILPASLTQGGLRTGLESLIGDLSLPVNLRMTAPRLPAQIEITVYFFVAEALTNVVKHARATRAGVTVQVDGATLWAEVRDDGIGGADPSGGTGLTGLSDRVQAADGTLTVTNAAGGGTVVRIALPLAETRL